MLRIDINNIVLIGDSAGAQITSNYAAIFTNPEYAALFNIVVPDIKVKAVGLNCGCYDGKKLYLTDEDQMFSGYIGIEKKAASSELLEMIDVAGHINSNFPPSFIISSKNDFLLPMAEPMYKLLKSKNVPSKMNIYGKKKQKEIAHVFSVNIDFNESKLCNDEQTDFFKHYLNQ